MCAVAASKIGHDVMKDDQAAVPHQRAVVLKIRLDHFIRIAVDKKHVEERLLLGERRLSELNTNNELSVLTVAAGIYRSEYSKKMIPHKYVLIVGCPRSGTSWLQRLLSQHPQVATTQETHLFSEYLAH